MGLLGRDQGAWCRAGGGDVFAVHVGCDQYVYLGSARPRAGIVAVSVMTSR